MSRTTIIPSLHGSRVLRHLAAAATVAAVATPSAGAAMLGADEPPGAAPRALVVAAPVAAPGSDSTGIEWTQVGAGAGAGALIALAIGVGLVGSRRVHTRGSIA